MSHYNLEWEKFLPNMLNYAVYNGFFHRSERTVHEQVFFRLKSQSRPVKYYDILKGRFLEEKLIGYQIRHFKGVEIS